MDERTKPEAPQQEEKRIEELELPEEKSADVKAGGRMSPSGVRAGKGLSPLRP